MLLNEIKLLEFTLERFELTVEQKAEVQRVQKLLPVRAYIPTERDVQTAEFIQL